MNKTVIFLAFFFSLSANAKILSVNCESKNGKSLELVSEIVNVNTPQKIKSLVVNGYEVLSFRDISKMPIYQNGDLSLNIQYGKNLFSSAELSLSKCNDDFEATGKAVVNEYVGGFAGKLPSHMNCSCSFK
jgi:serine protease inhibitor